MNIFLLGLSLNIHLLFILVLIVSSIGSALLLGFSIAAYNRYRSLPYMLIMLALLSLFIRSIIGWITTIEYISMNTHHFIEHILDIIIVALIISAVYYAKKVESKTHE